MSDAEARAESDVEAETTGERDTATRIRRGLDYVFLGGLVLFGLVAAVQFYFAADRTISIWVTREFRPLFKMVFNLVVLLVVGIGVTYQLRRLGGTESAEERGEKKRAETETS